MSTFGEKLFEELKQQGAALGRKLTRTEIITFTDRFYDAEHKKVKKPSPQISKMTEEQFVAWLEAEPALAGVDVKKEIGKCEFWCKANGKPAPSRRRIVNWVNGAERPLVGSYDGSSSRVKSNAPPKRKEPPHGWREFMKAQIEDWKDKNPRYANNAPGESELRMFDDFYRMPKSWQDAAWKELPE